MKAFIALCAVACTGIFASLALAAPSGTITPYVHCSDGQETVPGGSQLIVRSAWATGSWGNVQKFLDHQKITWSVYSADGSTLLASRTPSAFGDKTFWSEPQFGVGTIDGQDKSRWLTTYLAPTGVTVATGQSVKLVYNWSVDKKLDDDFGYDIRPGTIAETTSCVITGV